MQIWIILRSHLNHIIIVQVADHQHNINKGTLTGEHTLRNAEQVLLTQTIQLQIWNEAGRSGDEAIR